ncbi:MAG: sulfurtransferase [Salinisphaera sp.]|nr:sulfurtransferase [Salinisphaera sp.]
MTRQLPLFIRPQALSEAMGSHDVQIIAVDEPADFVRAHVPGALTLTMSSIMASQGATGGLLPDDNTLARILSDAGLRNDAQIVAYDRAGDGQAARLLYTLDAAAGHDRISLLDGGLAAWQAAGLPLEQGPPSAEPSDFRVTRQPDRIADREWIASRLDDDKTTILDVRSTAEFVGDDIRSARGGHVPGAVNLDWQHFKDDNGQLRPRAELEALLAEHDIRADREIAAYCQTHVRSSYVYLVLKYLGFGRVRGYPGAWSDWGNRDDTAIETGA